MIKIINIDFCLFLYIKSVNAINQHIRKKGRIAYPIIKVTTRLKFDLRKIIIRKETASGIQGLDKPIQERPT